MKKYAVVLAVVVVLFIFASVVSAFAKDIIWDDIGRGNVNLRTVLVNPDKPQIIYVGSTNAVLKSEDGGANWRNVLSVRGKNKAVNFLLFAPQDKNSLYAATGNGLFHSFNQGKTWNRIFQGKNYLENECTTLAVLSNTIYLGTKGGLFVSKDKGRTWHKETAKLGNAHILAIAYSLKEPNYIYVACTDGVFKTKDSGQSWERTFVASPTENGNETEEISEDRDEEKKSTNLRYISIDPNNSNYLYLATSRGVYKSQDKGENWESLSTFGLLNRDVRFLLVSFESHLYAVTKSGVFAHMNNRWQELSLGLAVGDIRFLAQDNQNNLYAACDTGLFKTSPTDMGGTKNDIIEVYLNGELDIRDIQEAAIAYAEVHPDKIKAWRKQASRKAWLPHVSMGLDRSTTDLWHWEGGSTTKADDDILRKGHDSVEWDVTLTWDLSELIWNNDQTLIDVRSKLMAELRDNILDEVTRIYFERIRVKMELDNLKIEERKKRLEKELRLKELASSLDALTGGYFSASLKSNHIGS
jgi:photosystem II stability/assembly factor-like uncharacterized protein